LGDYLKVDEQQTSEVLKTSEVSKSGREDSMKVIKIITILMMISCVSVNAFAQETIRLSSGEWPPYQSEHLKYNGVASRIVTEAFALAGVRVEYGYFPWARSLENAKTGEWDGTFLWFDTPERRKIFYISEPVLDIQYVFFHLRSEPFDWKNIGDLKGIFIGATVKYDYGKAFQSAEAAGTIKVERAPNDKVNFKKLLEGRIRIFPNDLDAGYEIINSNFTPEQARLFTYHKKPVRSAPHHMLFSKRIGRNRTMTERFNKGLKQLKSSGKIEQYLTESRKGEYKK